MSSAFLAWIIPVQTEAHPEHPIVLPPEQPPGTQPPGGAPPHPAHPIVLPGYPAHPIYIPGFPAHPIVLPPGEEPHPEHPIAPGGPPPHPSHPIVEIPAHPIVIPDPPDTKPPGGATGTPEQPIELPPPDLVGQKGHWAQAYFPALDGWIWVWVPERSMPPHPEQRGKKK